jgi:hypothetical protein
MLRLRTSLTGGPAAFLVLIGCAPLAAQQTELSSRVSGRISLSPAQLARLRAPNTILQSIGPRGIDTIGTGATVSLAPGEIVIAAPAGHATAGITTHSTGSRPNHFDISVPILALTRRGPRTLVVSVETGAGLRYDAGESAFSGVLHIGLEDADEPDRRLELQSAVPLQIIPLAGSASPDLIEMAHTEVPFQRVRLLASEPGDSLGIRILYALRQPVLVSVPVQRARLEINPTRVRINGFGLERATLSAVLPTELSIDSLPVSFSAPSEPDPLTAFATRNRPAITKIRSRGIGIDTVFAAGPHFVRRGAAIVEYAFPCLFLAAALLGGLVGAAIREAARKGRRSSSGRLPLNLLSGVLVGLLAAVAFPFVSLIPIRIDGPPVEAVVFAVAGIAAVLGAAALAGLLKKEA